MSEPQPLAKMELVRTASGRWEPASNLRDLSAESDAEVDEAFEGNRPIKGATPVLSRPSEAARSLEGRHVP